MVAAAFNRVRKQQTSALQALRVLVNPGVEMLIDAHFCCHCVNPMLARGIPWGGSDFQVWWWCPQHKQGTVTPPPSNPPAFLRRGQSQQVHGALICSTERQSHVYLPVSLYSPVCVFSPRYRNTGLMLMQVRPSEFEKTCPIPPKVSDTGERFKKTYFNNT